ncbi:hypothetical protein AMEX_G22491 [Astyanax mexicanus]|uniref:Uncharacterized protein n=1 Tax=Astyanax mexicanus TaxID=7994 RepID=A0A8T2KZG4_ASTMX|nr:hypothetical protein AMEX_G22491 [Astyanax mexicanus]
MKPSVEMRGLLRIKPWLRRIGAVPERAGNRKRLSKKLWMKPRPPAQNYLLLVKQTGVEQHSLVKSRDVEMREEELECRDVEMREE